LTGEFPIQEYASSGGVVVGADRVRVLVLLRPKRLGPDGRPEVRLPKGHIEPGEGRQQAAVREVCEEAGLSEVEILADLGHQTVDFDWKGTHFVRDESCFLMSVPPADPHDLFRGTGVAPPRASRLGRADRRHIAARLRPELRP